MGSKRCVSPAVWVFAGATLSACAATSTYEMRFWVSDTAAREAGRKHVEAHPCGALAEMWVDRLPSYDEQAVFQPEQIFEYDAAGRELRRWSSSVGARLIAARRDEILIESSGRQFWIATNGEIARNVRRSSSTWKNEDARCPRNGPNDSCSSFTDIETGASRTFSHPSICT